MDQDPLETREWLESLDGVLRTGGRARVRFLLERLMERANVANAVPDGVLTTDFVNTIPPEEEPPFPGDPAMEKRIRRMIRWNAMAMVVRANRRFDGIGGHISTYASAASLYEVGFNHFFHGKDAPGSGDQIYFQGHAAPGIYARAFLEGRLSEDQMDHFRRETERGRGLSSYPHPRLMPGFWEYPTVSMGLGPIAAIYQARFNRYLLARGLADTSKTRVWSFVGDGEMDEPEALGALWLAARERLDNLAMVVNCNLQRLDGPVRGNGKIIQELEALFRGAGWSVIKVIWGKAWDGLLARDTRGLLRKRMNEVVDGQFQKYTTAPGSYTRKDFFGAHPELEALVADLADDDIRRLRRGGHDHEKLYAAYRWAVEHRGRPTAILAHTVKGWTLGEGFEGRNVTHQMKKMTLEELRRFRDVLHLPIPDADLPTAPYFHPGPDSPEIRYLLERRHALGGFVPKRRATVAVDIELPASDVYEEFHRGSRKGGASTTAAYARLLIKLIRAPGLGARLVPIIPDEARTFGMDPYFREVGIYAARGQLYDPVDKGMLLYYREAEDGQLLEEGITEAGSMASFTAAGTTHMTHGQIIIPFYTFYSMFGFQRTADQLWAFGDARGRGFLVGGTAGRTTLNGEGLQHADGHSHVFASVIPNLRAYDPAWAYEIALIIEDGLRRMVTENEDVFYYLTVHNEAYDMPPMPRGARVKEGVLQGLYRFRKARQKKARHVQLFGSGSILNEALRAQEMLAARFNVSADVWSATSYQLLRKDALACERWNRLHPEAKPHVPYVSAVLKGTGGPFVAASDFLKAVPDQIARWVPRRYVTLGTDGFGMSDTRPALRRHFEVDAESIVLAALHALQLEGKVTAKTVARALQDLDYDPEKLDPVDI